MSLSPKWSTKSEEIQGLATQISKFIRCYSLDTCTDHTSNSTLAQIDQKWYSVVPLSINLLPTIQKGLEPFHTQTRIQSTRGSANGVHRQLR